MHSEVPESLKLKAAKYHFEHGAVEIALKTIASLAQSGERESVKLKAAETILQHELELAKYEEPAEAKHEVTIKILDYITSETLNGA